jgi:hypothetical protein
VQQRVEQMASEPSGIGDEEINLDTLSAYLKRKFPGRRSAPPEYISDLIEELASTGYLTISHLDQDIERARDAFTHYEQQAVAAGDPGFMFIDIGVVRVSLNIANPIYNAHTRGKFGRSDDPYVEFRQYLPDRDEI